MDRTENDAYKFLLQQERLYRVVTLATTWGYTDPPTHASKNSSIVERIMWSYLSTAATA
jgi:hypothetical protein